MSNSPNDVAAARLATQMRYSRAPDWEEVAEAQRAAGYASFDRAVDTLPAEKAQMVNLHQSLQNADGWWDLRDIGGARIVLVRDPAAPKPEPKEKASKAQATIAAPAPAPRGMTKGELKRINENFTEIDECFGLLSDAVNALVKRITAVEALAERVQAIEQRGFRFVGKYQAPAAYSIGDVVSYKGALWNCVANAKVGDRPNTASVKWTLMISGIQE